MVVLLKRHGAVLIAGAVCVLINSQGIGPLWYTGVALIVCGLLMRWVLVSGRRPRGEAAPVPLSVPVTGRPAASDGPGTKVPSPRHTHTHAHSHAQTYAVDVWRYRDDDGEEHVGVPEDLTHFTPVPEARR